MNKFTKEIHNTFAGTYLVKFGAPWCGPCRQMSPTIEAMDEEGYNVYDVNIDEDTEELAQAFGIRSVPTTIIISNKEIVETLVGVQTKEKLIKLLKGEK